MKTFSRFCCQLWDFHAVEVEHCCGTMHLWLDISPAMLASMSSSCTKGRGTLTMLSNNAVFQRWSLLALYAVNAFVFCCTDCVPFSALPWKGVKAVQICGADTMQQLGGALLSCVIIAECCLDMVCQQCGLLCSPRVPVPSVDRKLRRCLHNSSTRCICWLHWPDGGFCHQALVLLATNKMGFTFLWLLRALQHGRGYAMHPGFWCSCIILNELELLLLSFGIMWYTEHVYCAWNCQHNSCRLQGLWQAMSC